MFCWIPREGGETAKRQEKYRFRKAHPETSKVLWIRWLYRSMQQATILAQDLRTHLISPRTTLRRSVCVGLMVRTHTRNQCLTNPPFLLSLLEGPAFSRVQVVEFQNTYQVHKHKNHETCSFSLSRWKPETDDLPKITPYGNGNKQEKQQWNVGGKQTSLSEKTLGAI